MVGNHDSGDDEGYEDKIKDNTSWDAKAGDTLLVPSGPSGNHLFIVLFDPQSPIDISFGKKLHLAQVNFTSVRSGMNYDSTCIVEPGDHSFITHKSYVNYSRLRYEEYEPIKRGVQNGRLLLHEPVTYDLLCRIREGAITSNKTPTFVKYEIQKLCEYLKMTKSA
ncbi:hypothetical protein [Acinetobacter lanii]|uniref:Uncharacterized protein n=1 Tax=Acinetobacter lanii TaxID=2715163 RepID=A0A6G8S7W9_9GAMM|nr:hypothetical protein [Acinetobacter lanii]QIO10023.1 hypothetical protein G8D99_14065 [Acinetobacter lanii]